MRAKSGRNILIVTDACVRCLLHFLPGDIVDPKQSLERNCVEPAGQQWHRGSCWRRQRIILDGVGRSCANTLLPHLRAVAKENGEELIAFSILDREIQKALVAA